MHPSTKAILRYFEYSHLKDDQRIVSEKFYRIAHEMVNILPGGAEMSAGLRKLLEAKDCFVRASFDLPPWPNEHDSIP